MISYEEPQYYTMPYEEILGELKTNIDQGLTQEQISLSASKYGRNYIEKKKKSIWKALFAPIINLLIIIYLISAFAMWLLGEVRRTTPTFIILGANALIAIIQQLRAEKQLKALQKLSQANATVIRNGIQMEIPSEQVVVGDIILFKQGDKVPADCRIIKSMNLYADESALTGESEPVKKSRDGERISSENGVILPLQDQKNMLFLGTFITSGTGMGIAVKVGMKTELGKISRKLEESTTGDIPLRKKMNHIAIYLGIGVLIILILSIFYKIYLLQSLGIFSAETLRLAMIDSIDLGMKVMPINLPLLTTIVLLTGVLLLAQKGVIVRELSRTETLGRISVVCSDKTGTLTKNEMTVHFISTPLADYKVSGNGYIPDGEIMELGKDVPVGRRRDLDLLITSGFLNNNAVITTKDVDTVKFTRIVKKIHYSVIGLPTEAAIKVLAQKYSDILSELQNKYSFVHEFSFDSSVKRMSKIFKDSTEPDSYYLFCKGATEWILPLCSSYLKESVVPMDEPMKNKILTKMQEYANKGYRVLSITYRKLSKNDIPAVLEESTSRSALENNMVFLGLIIILDPPRDDVFDAVKQCRSAGVKPIMITGDSISTGKAIAQQIGIFNSDTDLAVEGKDIATLDDDSFYKVSVFGRVTPEHKEQIISKYQDRNQVVAMTGDGVNDALALSMADCGLAMGISGTEVAKEAADMVITDDSFSTIVTGIREGRGLFEKIRTIIYFFVCVSVMEAIILFSSSLNPDPYFAMWDYWQLNLLYLSAHFFPALGFTFGTTSRTIMNEKPRDSAEILDRRVFSLILIQMFFMGTAIVIGYLLPFLGYVKISSFNMSYYIDWNVGYAQQKARTMGFVVLFLLEGLFMPMQIRRLNQPVSESFRDIKYLKEFLMYPISIIILVGIMYSVDAQEAMASVNIPMGFMALDLYDWLICFLLVMYGFLGFELVRKYLRENKKIVF
jgi:Ca2+-transporting ATPase